MKLLLLSIVCMLLLPAAIKAQDTAVVLPFIVNEQGDTITLYESEKVVYEEQLTEEDRENQKRWNKLIRDVRATMPLAQQLVLELGKIDSQMALLETKKEQRKFLNSQEERLREQYEEKLKKLYRSQGVLLIKLVDRETSRSSYELIKAYRSGLTARFWQTTAKIFGMDLKEEYSPEEEAEIEQVLQFLGYD